MRPACLSLNSSPVHNKAVPVRDEERDAAPSTSQVGLLWSFRGPQAIQIAQTVTVQGLGGQCHLLSQLSGSSQHLNRKTLFQMESDRHRIVPNLAEYTQSATEINTILKLPYCRKIYFHISVDHKAAQGSTGTL